MGVCVCVFVLSSSDDYMCVWFEEKKRRFPEC